MKKKYFPIFLLLLAFFICNAKANDNGCNRNANLWFNFTNGLTGSNAQIVTVYFQNISSDCTDTNNTAEYFGKFLTTANSSSTPYYLMPGQSLADLASPSHVDLNKGIFVDINPQNRDANCTFDTYVSWSDPATSKEYSFYFGTQFKSVNESSGNYCIFKSELNEKASSF